MPTGRRHLTSYLVAVDQKLSCDIEMIFAQNSSTFNSDTGGDCPPKKIPGCATAVAYFSAFKCSAHASIKPAEMTLNSKNPELSVPLKTSNPASTTECTR